VKKVLDLVVKMDQAVRKALVVNRVMDPKTDSMVGGVAGSGSKDHSHEVGFALHLDVWTSLSPCFVSCFHFQRFFK
jgi:hypothetical protein